MFAVEITEITIARADVGWFTEDMKTFSAKGTVDNTTFHRLDLLALERLLEEEAEDGLHISNVTLYFEEGKIEVDTFSELVDEEYASFEKNPKGIRITAHGWKDRQGEGSRRIWKSAYVNIWKLSTEYHVNGDDQTWVFGLSKQLQRFLSTKKKWDLTNVAWIALTIVSSFVAFSFLNALSDDRSTRATALLGLWVLVVALGLGFSFWSVFKGPSRIYLKDRPTRGIDYQLWALWATVGSAIVGLIGTYLIAKYVQ